MLYTSILEGKLLFSFSEAFRVENVIIYKKNNLKKMFTLLKISKDYKYIKKI